MSVEYDNLRRQCWDYYHNSFGYSYIHDKRTRRYGRSVNLLKVFGLLVPALIGSVVLGYGTEYHYLKKMVAAAIPVTIIQFLFSLLAVIYKWDDELSYSFEASQSYITLADRFKKLASVPPAEFSALDKEFDLLVKEYTLRNQQDSKHNIKDWELRLGMRYALRERRKECAGCRLVPISMQSTDCPVCGNFSKKHKIFNL